MTERYNLGDGDKDPPGLAAAIRDRDPAAVREVVRIYLPQILRAAAGAGLEGQLAEDVVQSTFLTFLETAHKFEGRSRVRTWWEIDGCLETVPTKQRMAFVLREVEELDTKEICKILDVTRTNLGVLLHRARMRLRECLGTKQR